MKQFTVVKSATHEHNESVDSPDGMYTIDIMRIVSDTYNFYADDDQSYCGISVSYDAIVQETFSDEPCIMMRGFTRDNDALEFARAYIARMYN
jgi:hypothetical protein